MYVVWMYVCSMDVVCMWFERDRETERETETDTDTERCVCPSLVQWRIRSNLVMAPLS